MFDYLNFYGSLIVTMLLGAVPGLSLYPPLMAGQLSLASPGPVRAGQMTLSGPAAELVTDERVRRAYLR